MEDNDNNMITDICENPSPNDKRSSPRIEKLKAQKALGAHSQNKKHTPVKNNNNKTINIVSKVEQSRTGVENKSVYEENQGEEESNKDMSMNVCEEKHKQAVEEETVKRMENKRQKLEDEKLVNQMTEDDNTAYAVVTEALRTFYKYYLHAVQVYLFLLYRLSPPPFLFFFLIIY